MSVRAGIVAVVVVVVGAVARSSGAQPGMADPSSAPPPAPEVATGSADDIIQNAGATLARRVTFEQAVGLAIEHSSDARIAADEVVRADALLQQSAAALRPLVGLAAQYQQLEGNRYSRGVETEAAESFLGELTFSMPLVDLRKHAETHRARDNLDVERMTAAATRRTVAIAAGRAYLSVFAAERLIEVAELARQTAKAHVDYATSRTRGGLGTDLDIVRAQSELATDEQNLATAQYALVQAEEALGVLAGQSAPLGSTTEPSFPDSPDVASIVSRADVLAGRRQLSAATWSRDAQWTEYAPVLSLNGIGFYDTPELAPTPTWGFQILASLTFTLYDGGYRAGLAQERDALEAEAHEQLAQVERTALGGP